MCFIIYVISRVYRICVYSIYSIPLLSKHDKEIPSPEQSMHIHLYTCVLYSYEYLFPSSLLIPSLRRQLRSIVVHTFRVSFHAKCYCVIYTSKLIALYQIKAN